MMTASDVALARAWLSGSPRLSYILNSAIDDHAHGRNERRFRIARESGALVLRSRFGKINVFYLHGPMGASEWDWISSFAGPGEIHCGANHLAQAQSSPLASRIAASDPVCYYRLTQPSIGDIDPRPQRIGEEHLPHVREFIEKFNDDAIDYPGMFELPAFGIWADGKLVSMAATLFVHQQTQSCQIGGFLTDPDYRGRGLAKCLGQVLIRHLVGTGIEAIRLEVYAENVGASRFYEQLGFVVEDESPMIVLSEG